MITVGLGSLILMAERLQQRKKGREAA
jgi:hypothetical protein